MRQTAYNVHSLHLLGEPGRASTLTGLKRARPENFRQKTGRAGPGLRSNGPGRAVIFRPVQGSSSYLGILQQSAVDSRHICVLYNYYHNVTSLLSDNDVSYL